METGKTGSIMTAATPVGNFRSLLNSTGITQRLGEIMPQRKMARFKSQLTQIVTGSPQLQNCDPMSVIAAAIGAANIGLDISPAFGQAAVIPFNNTVKMPDGTTRTVRMAQLQIMTKGWTQLALRSGKYDWINADAIYEDEYRGSDLMSGMVHAESVPGGYRDQGMKDRIVGFFAAYRLTNGGQKLHYMTLREIEVHARTYSKTYGKSHKLPVPQNWKPDLYATGIGWENGWYAMARKTVLKLLLQRWGLLSLEMEEAIEADQAAFSSIGGEPVYVDNMGEIEETSAQAAEEEPQPDEASASQSDVEALFSDGSQA